MTFLFNEQSAVENMIEKRVVDNDNVFTTIKDLARYNYFVKNMEKDDNYKSILKYLQNNGTNINEENVYKIIDDCIQRAKKYPFKLVDEICITKSEIEFIKKLNDIKREKIAFVLLASAKYYDAARGTKYCTTYMNNSDICKLARITIPVVDRNVFMQFAYDCGVLSRHSRAASTEKKVLFVSHDENDEVAFTLKENDFKDLAYAYLARITPHKYRQCIVCRKWMKKDSKGRQVCKECSEKEDMEHNTIKEVQCDDCGKTVYVSVFNAKTFRCEECQKKADYTPMETKIIICVDCRKEFEITAKDSRTVRCEYCLGVYKNEYMKNYMQKRRKKDE